MSTISNLGHFLSKAISYITEVTAVKCRVVLVLELRPVHSRPFSKLNMTSLNFLGIMRELRNTTVSVRNGEE